MSNPTPLPIPTAAPLGVIIDVGAHTGDDTEFYLAKGYRVIAVEANPRLNARLRERFAGALRSERLVLLEGAIADESRRGGTVEFYVNLDKDDWSSTDANYGTRQGTRFEKISSPVIVFDDLLRQYPDVYYIKSDIEGGDVEVLKSMVRFNGGRGFRSPYFSVEVHDAESLSFLAVLGYRQFKLVNQNLNWATPLPNPPKEGVFVQHMFPPHSSGPFGEETIGTWMGLDETMEMYLALKRAQEKQPTISNGWYDVHAKK